MTTPPSHHPTDEDHDADLRRALRGLPPPDADAAAVEALQRRVMARWAVVHRVADPVVAMVPATAGSARGREPAGSSARGWRIVLAGGLVLAAVAATVAGLQRPDPSIDELMRLDVLSQIAAGEL